ncbi:serine--tRNA ligase [Faunimonas sp. B44]|uniref:serine--tRNA ligase n=1 Tax=Faunimonas sp. B44 TaxID=3461493 RepID=UPI004043AEBB
MLDIKWIRENPDDLDRALGKRGAAPAAAGLIALDEARRAIIQRLQDAQGRRNAASKEIGQAKAQKDDARAAQLMAEVASLKDVIRTGEEEERAAEAALADALANVPNVPLPDVPEGPDETANVEVRSWGERRAPDGAREHFELGEALGLMDFEAAARLSGSRFVVLKGQLARMERALGQFMLDLHTEEHGYTEVQPPVLVRDDALYGTAQLPKFAEDQFRTTDGRWLIPTAEVPLTNLVREQILDAFHLPIRLTALTPCFRSEAGSAGRDTRGMLRQHQFDKVELVSITRPEDSLAEHERMTTCAEEVLKRLDLAYRVMLLSTGDMGFASRKTYDLEVWLPGQKAYREISSCSVCGDFQARRMQARYRPQDEKQPRFVHTLNGSGVAVGRALIAVMETYQNADGSITVPEALRPYMGGVERIG